MAEQAATSSCPQRRSEIRETAETLRKRHPEHCEICRCMHACRGRAGARVQAVGPRRVCGHQCRETSLTVPASARHDTGLAPHQPLQPSQRAAAAADREDLAGLGEPARSGCGRLGTGHRSAPDSEEDLLSRRDFTEPAIPRTNLAAVILQMHALRLGDIERFPFVEPRRALCARRRAHAAGAGRNGSAQRLTTWSPAGEAARRSAPWAHVVAARRAQLAEVAVIVAALGVPDPRDGPSQATRGPEAPLFRDEKSIPVAAEVVAGVAGPRTALSKAKLRAWCREHFLSYVRMLEWHDIHGQIMEVLKGELAMTLNTQPADYESVHRALLAGLISHVCQRREQAEYLGTRGQKVFIHPGSGQFRARPAWIVCAEQVETTRIYARTVARVDPLWIEQVAAHLVRRQHYEPHWERSGARVVVNERSTLFALTLQSGRKVNYERIAPREARELFIRHALVQMDYASQRRSRAHRRLLEEAAYLQQKGRRVDLLADAAQRLPFFDARIPEHVPRWRFRALAPRGRAPIRRRCSCSRPTSAPAMAARSIRGASRTICRPGWCASGCHTGSSLDTRKTASRRWSRCTHCRSSPVNPSSGWYRGFWKRR